ncbi:STAS domain-containing protein [Streptomyces sp. G-G2]|uniref:STAS domain-containing protein n=1 Tax=Streptomyces sp. G-G2 TaxID=3046201 RepID=UPI0024B9D66A|nr:STAS domain-containing protein [Streptomyces sp. G-G2]MDJ0382762.1 STAS domain-containing protein [Streptomyces sp. G-G2]
MPTAAAAAAASYAAPGPLGAELRDDRTGAVVCAFEGDLDLDGLGRVQPVLDEALRSGAPRLVVDLARLGFCDSSGLNLLLSLRLDAERQGVSLRLAAPNEQLSRLLRLTGADTVFTIDRSVADALAAP